jgi:uncharacterized protein YndB with AHSA1/START domain
MTRARLAALLAALLLAAPAAAQEVRNTSFAAPDGGRVLQQSVVVPARLADVWAAFTTAEGWKSWAVPVAGVDFRVGGIVETSYRADAKLGDSTNIKNRFLSYLPQRMVSFQIAQTPPGFPHPELGRTLFSVVELEDLGDTRVRVTLSQLGYRAGAGYDALYKFFEAGNAWSLQQLHKRFAEGPVDWARATPTKK